MDESDFSDDGKILSQRKIMRALEWAYDQAVDGVPYMSSAEDLASSYDGYHGTLTERANALIRWQVVKAGTSGAITGLGGIIFMPVALPVSITSVLYIQVRMIAAIAHMGGCDLKDDRVRPLFFACLVLIMCEVRSRLNPSAPDNKGMLTTQKSHGHESGPDVIRPCHWLNLSNSTAPSAMLKGVHGRAPVACGALYVRHVAVDCIPRLSMRVAATGSVCAADTSPGSWLNHQLK